MQQHLSLQPFSLAQSELLISWLPSEQFALTWGGPRYSWPVTHAQIADYFSQVAVNAFWFCVNDKPIGYIELAEKPNDEISLCRIIIEQNSRGQGLGKKLIEQAINKAREEYGAKSIELAVYDHNTSALNCYLGFGFETYIHQNRDIPAKAMRRMRLYLD